MNNLWTSFYEALFPKHCFGCRQEGSWLCPNCQKRLSYLKTFSCPFCQTVTNRGELCLNCQSQYSLTGILAACSFQSPTRELIHQLKYQKTKELCQLLTKILIKGTVKRLPEGRKIIVPVPLHPNQLRKRGFNQAELLAQELAQRLEITYNPDILKRIKDTKSQTKLNRQERLANLKDAFALNQKMDLRGISILLVDDVSTTGITLDQAAKALRLAQPNQIWGLVVAKG
jgi:competence protein ComFC